MATKTNSNFMTKAKRYGKTAGVAIVGLMLLNTAAKRFSIAAKVKQTVDNGL